MHGVHGRVIQNGIHIWSQHPIACTTARPRVAHLDRGHDGPHILGTESEDAVENADFIITEGLLSGAMELEERLEFRHLVRVCLVRAEDMV